MKADFIKDKIRLFNCDCMAFMAEIPDGYYELAIVDPPYGLPERSGKGAGKLANRIIQDMHKSGWDIAPKDSYFKELFRISKHQVIWGGNYFNLPPTRGIVCWDKKQPWQNFSAWEMAWTSFDMVAKIFRFDNRYSGKTHPTQKPIELYSWLLDNYAKPNDKIFDSHGGSFSSACAALDMGFEFDGCELDEDYFKSAVNRLENHNQLYLEF